MPAVSVIVPTLNAGATIGRCLASVRAQTRPVAETIVVDSWSSDRTAEIATRSAQVLSVDSSMTQARLIGAERATGAFVLSLDADQWLVPDAVERCLATHSPMVVLGENSVGRGLVAIANRADRAAVERNWQANADPVAGPICPRFFERSLFLDSIRDIPRSLLSIRPAPYAEDMIIYRNAVRRGARPAYVPGVVYHTEMDSVAAYARKWFRYGRNARRFRGTELERFATQRGRRNLRGVDYVRTVPARALKGVPYYLGYFMGATPP